MTELFYGRGEKTAAKAFSACLKTKFLKALCFLRGAAPNLRLFCLRQKVAGLNHCNLFQNKMEAKWSPFYFGRGERTQTFDLSVPNRARYQLRHTPILKMYPGIVYQNDVKIYTRYTVTCTMVL